MDLKGVWDAARTENQRAGRAADGLIADQRSDLALQDVEALVLVAMDVARRAIALAGECFDQRESSLRLVTGGEESEQPASLPERVLERPSSPAERSKQIGSRRRAEGCCHGWFLSMKSTLRSQGIIARRHAD